MNARSRPLQGAANDLAGSRIGAQSTAPGLMSHALAYARVGLDVLPLTPGGKTPLGALVAHGKDDAAHDAEQVRDWWVQCPTANIGVRPAEGVVVVDVDPRAGGATALERPAFDVTGGVDVAGVSLRVGARTPA